MSKSYLLKKKFRRYTGADFVWPRKGKRGRPRHKLSKVKPKRLKFSRQSYGKSRRTLYNKIKMDNAGTTKKFADKVKAVMAIDISANNVYIENYTDYIQLNQPAINTAAQQFMWANNQHASGGIAVNSRVNLLVDDPFVISGILSNIQNVDTTKFTRKTYETTARIVNSDSAPIVLYEYRCQARRDQALSVANLHTQLLIGGFADSQAGFGGTAPLTAVTVGATPYMNNRFTTQIKIVKVRKWFLRPAQVKQLTYKSLKPRVFNRESIAPNATPYSVARKQRFSVFVIQGTFAFNSTASAANQYGMTAASVGISYMTKVSYSWVQDQSMASGGNIQTMAQPSGAFALSSQFPAPFVIVHPDSAVGPGAVAGARAYAANEACAIEEHSFNVN